jgi:cold shock CspA family protein
MCDGITACVVATVSSRRAHAAASRATQVQKDKGFGFIAVADGAEYFFHQSACTRTPFDQMREGDQASFTIGHGALIRNSAGVRWGKSSDR